MEHLHQRRAPVEMDGETFRRLGYQVVDRLADFLDALSDKPVAPGDSPEGIRAVLGDGGLPAEGTPAEHLLDEAADLLFDHSTFNGHPRFLGYITSSATPIGALGDLLASGVNPNVGGFMLSPMATEIEAQTIRWIAELIGYPTDCGGLLVSGGNMANFTAFLAARHAKAGWHVRAEGLRAGPQLVVYGSRETHTWIQKAADLFGLGTDAIRWVATDAQERIDLEALERQIEADRAAGYQPFLVVGAAGTVSTGAVDPLPALAALCREQDLWFHVDGAYGAPAAALSKAPADLKGLREADSLALDPHKWLYSPLEAGCVLVRRPQDLANAYSYHPDYYTLDTFDEGVPINYLEWGLQNSRGFRALKVWLGLRQVGRAGYEQMMSEDISLAQALYQVVDAHPELEAVTQNLSITTFRFIPQDVNPEAEGAGEYLNELNEALVHTLEEGGEVFVSNAVVDERYLLRACIVNFRTSFKDVEALPEIIVRVGRKLHEKMQQ